ncbi:MAG: hypothetical protein JXA10_16125 [Anaerolineae bacterium]|nr:hypothetical protein [Anaerolineae bacterium]
MSFLAYLILVVIFLGLGTLTASILPTRGARIGLGTVLFLALLVDATWFIVPLVGWSADLIDVIWIVAFGVVFIVAAMMASYYSGVSDQPTWTWPSSRDFMAMLVVIAIFGAVMLVLPVPLDTDAQGFGYLALTLRGGEDFTTLAPWHPETEYLYSPAFTGLIAHFSARFDIGIHALQFALGALVVVLFVWTAYDLGCEIEDRRTGRTFMITAIIGTGLITAFMDSHFTALLALTFSLAFITFVMRFLDEWRWPNALAAAVCLAGVPLSQPDTTIALIIGYAPWLLFVWFAKPRPNAAAWVVIAAVIPLITLGIVSPWLSSIMDLLESNIESPFMIDTDHWRTMLLMHGGLVVVLAIIGMFIGLWKRHPIYWLMAIWLVGIVEFSIVGLLEENFPGLMEPLLKYDYPFSLAWHGPIIPYTVLGGTGLLWLTNRFGKERIDHFVAQLAVPVLTLALAGLVVGVLLFDPLLNVSKEYVNFFGVFSSSADVAAMEWLRDNAPVDARILNHPGPHEADWVPVIAERDTIYFRPQPFFQHTDAFEDEQAAFRAFWLDPANPDHAEMLLNARVRYVIVPQVFGNPDSLNDMVRWREPLPEAASYLRASRVEDAPYLTLVYEKDGAQVYEVTVP